MRGWAGCGGRVRRAQAGGTQGTPWGRGFSQKQIPAAAWAGEQAGGKAIPSCPPQPGDRARAQQWGGQAARRPSPSQSQPKPAGIGQNLGAREPALLGCWFPTSRQLLPGQGVPHQGWMPGEGGRGEGVSLQGWVPGEQGWGEGVSHPKAGCQGREDGARGSHNKAGCQQREDGVRGSLTPKLGARGARSGQGGSLHPPAMGVTCQELPLTCPSQPGHSGININRLKKYITKPLLKPKHSPGGGGESRGERGEPPGSASGCMGYGRASMPLPPP